MKKNQKYSPEEMYMAIELWKESGLSLKNYCVHNHIAFSTFKYWQKKLQKENFKPDSKLSRPFISIDVPSGVDLTMPIAETVFITIDYPNGIQVCCPANINHEQLRALIKL
jgi:hypothetical protein